MKGLERAEIIRRSVPKIESTGAALKCRRQLPFRCTTGRVLRPEFVRFSETESARHSFLLWTTGGDARPSPRTLHKVIAVTLILVDS
jgi:hypothetical protein